MPFDLDKLEEYCNLQIEKFALKHPNEWFYAFAIDADLLCFNSIEKYQKLVNGLSKEWLKSVKPIKRWEDLTVTDHQKYETVLSLAEQYSGLDRSDKVACLAVINDGKLNRQKKGNPYDDEEQLQIMKANTGDWAYQGFATLRKKYGFDPNAYDEHYDMEQDLQKKSEYAIAMEELLSRLKENGVFNKLHTTDDFYAIRVEHN